ncbi:MAG: PAS domain S-box protein, partial [Acidobacteria bacterium]|nr:PAS domain S-box protein [Acidobacteriota bacterium]
MVPVASPYPGDPSTKPPAPTDLGEVPVEVVRRAVETHGDGICITDAELSEPGPRIVYVNQAFTVITGYQHEDIIGRTPRILQGPLTDRD